MDTIAITGASGYIGRCLIAELIRMGDKRVKVLSRSRQQYLHTGAGGSNVEVMEGDLRKPESLEKFLEPGCAVVNLVHLWAAGEAENLAASANLLKACRAAKIGRLIHCSTAAVVGRVPDNSITESTPCRPITEYGITKLKVEGAVLDAARGCFDAAILRPTSVFGPGGEPLKKLAGDLTAGNRLENYLRSCLFGRRRINLVHVANVVAAIIFLIKYTEKFNGEIFIVSDDDSPSNNFADVECFLMREFGILDYGLPRVPMSPSLLSFLLACLGRNNINPRCDYDPDKLIALGFKRPVSFESGLAEYATWYRSSRPDNIESSAA